MSRIESIKVIAALSDIDRGWIGPIGFVGELSDGRLYRFGKDGFLEDRFMSHVLLDEWVDGGPMCIGGLAYRVPSTYHIKKVDVDMSQHVVGLWIGKDIAFKLEMIGLPSYSENIYQGDVYRVNPEGDAVAGKTGKFIVCTFDHAIALMKAMCRDILRLTMACRKPSIAKLGIWILPDLDEVRSAIWFTTPEEKRHDMLNFYVKLDRDKGKQSTVESIQTTIKATIRKYENGLIPQAKPQTVTSRSALFEELDRLAVLMGLEGWNVDAMIEARERLDPARNQWLSDCAELGDVLDKYGIQSGGLK